MRTTFSALVAALAMVMSIIVVPSAGASTLDSQLERLVELQMIPADVNRTELGKQLARAAAKEGVSETALLATMIRDGEKSLAASGIRPTAACENDDRIILGYADRKGDLFISPAWTSIANHGHTGIYYSTTVVVEAPGSSSNSRSISGQRVKVCPGAERMKVETSAYKRRSAANFAYNRYRGKPYDIWWGVNKTNGSGELNCSELVWRAYKHSRANIDLDDNDGGTSIIPYMIKWDRATTVYESV
ncbi:hypothetical protein [Myceligenerans crystallogenes]|uniref:Permuted papain-like amidase enzyme, YaeF/YiiX, C92 family n=1 Tax=Myceligenerans crystallogenes TaxID=316335 RepID=A0ABN2N2X4_9MICO